MINIKINGLSTKDEYPDKITNKDEPEFTLYKEDIGKLKNELEPYQKYHKLIVIGHGGSITSFAVYLRALKGNGKKVFLINTNEPDIITNVKKEFKPIDTVVICISKSGSNISNLEGVMQFTDYQVIVVTENDDTPLAKIAEHFAWKIIKHPPIGGRFSGFTASSFVPSILFGLPVDRIQNGAREMYIKCNAQNKPKDNPAWRIADALYQFDLVGKDEIFLALYSYYLETCIPLIMQLVHETTCKNGKGLTVVGAVGPESQHHTNQRFFGGKKNMIGVFVTVDEQRDNESRTKIPEELSKIDIKDGELGMLNNIKLSDALTFEAKGTKQDALEQKIPVIEIEIDKIDSNNIAQFIALWQLVVYYLAILFDVNPFDQPQVERSKVISAKLRHEINAKI